MVVESRPVQSFLRAGRRVSPDPTAQLRRICDGGRTLPCAIRRSGRLADRIRSLPNMDARSDDEIPDPRARWPGARLLRRSNNVRCQLGGEPAAKRARGLHAPAFVTPQQSPYCTLPVEGSRNSWWRSFGPTFCEKSSMLVIGPAIASIEFGIRGRSQLSSINAMIEL